MINQSIHIIEFKILNDILEEIKGNLKFEIFNYPKCKYFVEKLNDNKLDLSNSLIVLNNENKINLDEIKLDKKNILILKNFPIEINKLVQTLNIQLIKQKYYNQSKVVIKDYMINLNSRIISRDERKLKLTEKEINIILFLNDQSRPQKINILQNKVWGYSSNLETHTVETHIYRLRKKIKDIFKDDSFIVSHIDGYTI